MNNIFLPEETLKISEEAMENIMDLIEDNKVQDPVIINDIMDELLDIQAQAQKELDLFYGDSNYG